jgi:protein-tyrosine phosphatase
VIDLHAHILPGVDDGPRTLEDSFALARAALDSGTTVMAATSHVTHGIGNGDASAFPAATAALAREFEVAGIPLELRVGAELAPSRIVDLDDETLRSVALGGGPYLLLECPFSPVAPDLEPLVSELQARGHRVLLGHPERCAAFHRRPERLGRLIDGGALVQITGVSLLGDFGGTVRRFAVALLREGLVHVVASDAHDAVHRPPGLTAGLAEAEHDLPGLSIQVRWLTEEAPAAILAGDPLPVRPPLPPLPRGGLLRRRKLGGLLRRA